LLAAALELLTPHAFIGITVFAPIVEALPAVTFVVIDACPTITIVADGPLRVLAACVIGRVTPSTTAIAKALAAAVAGGCCIVTGDTLPVVAERRVSTAARVIGGVAALALAVDAFVCVTVEECALWVALAGPTLASALIADGGYGEKFTAKTINGVANTTGAADAEIHALVEAFLGVFAPTAGERWAVTNGLGHGVAAIIACIIGGVTGPTLAEYRAVCRDDTDA